jgi:hypothetical protein
MWTISAHEAVETSELGGECPPDLSPGAHALIAIVQCAKDELSLLPPACTFRGDCQEVVHCMSNKKQPVKAVLCLIPLSITPVLFRMSYEFFLPKSLQQSFSIIWWIYNFVSSPQRTRPTKPAFVPAFLDISYSGPHAPRTRTMILFDIEPLRIIFRIFRNYDRYYQCAFHPDDFFIIVHIKPCSLRTSQQAARASTSRVALHAIIIESAT